MNLHGIIFLSLILLVPFVSSEVYSESSFEFSIKNSEKLVIYTYDYFFGLTADSNTSEIYKKIFTDFSERYGIEVEVHFFDGARNIYLEALQRYKTNQRTADLLVGIDNVVVQEAKAQGLLEKLNISALENYSNVREDLIRYLDPELYAIPYDYGPIAFIYDSERINLTELTFEDFSEKSLAEKLVLEDPTTSTTGIEFLMWQIAVYERLLGKDWRIWWEKIKSIVDVKPSWGDAYFDVFMNEQAGRPIVVSYLTSPVYHYLHDNTTRYKPMLVKYNGSWYAWYQVQGIGIVKNSPVKEYAYKFIDWLLSDEIQELVYNNDIMLPAHKEKINEIPEDVLEVMRFNLTEIKAANDLLPTSEIASNISTWLKEWQEIMTAPPISNAMILLGLIILIVMISIAIYQVYYRRNYPQ